MTDRIREAINRCLDDPDFKRIIADALAKLDAEAASKSPRPLKLSDAHDASIGDMMEVYPLKSKSDIMHFTVNREYGGRCDVNLARPEQARLLVALLEDFGVDTEMLADFAQRIMMDGISRSTSGDDSLKHPVERLGAPLMRILELAGKEANS